MHLPNQIPFFKNANNTTFFFKNKYYSTENVTPEIKLKLLTCSCCRWKFILNFSVFQLCVSRGGLLILVLFLQHDHSNSCILIIHSPVLGRLCNNIVFDINKWSHLQAGWCKLLFWKLVMRMPEENVQHPEHFNMNSRVIAAFSFTDLKLNARSQLCLFWKQCFFPLVFFYLSKPYQDFHSVWYNLQVSETSIKSI